MVRRWWSNTYGHSHVNSHANTYAHRHPNAEDVAHAAADFVTFPASTLTGETLALVHLVG